MSHRYHTKFAILVAAVGLSLCTGGFAFGQAAADPTVRDRYVQASELYHQRKYEDCRKILAEIWPKTKTHDVAALYGQVEMKTGHQAEAARYFSMSLAKLPPTEPVRKGETLKKWLGDMKKHVSTYELLSNVVSATVSVDGVDYGLTPLETPIFVAPGKHIVMVALSGYKSGDAILDGVAGASEKLEINLQPEPAAVAAPPVATGAPQLASVPVAQPPAQAPPLVTSKPNPWILVGGGVITVGGVVAGLVFNAKANTAHDDADSIQNRVGPYGCVGTIGAQAKACSDLHEYNQTHDRDRNVSTAAFVIGGVALAGTFAYWVWPRGSNRGGTSGNSVVISSNGSSVQISGAF